MLAPGGFVFENCSRTKCCSHLAISQRWDSGTAGLRSPANRPTRVRDGAGGAYFPDKIETHKYVFVSVLCVSLAKGVDTVCRELPLRCRWSYYVWCGRGGGLVSEGVNRYVTAPEALCTQEGRRCLSIFFHPHPCYHHSLSLSFWASKRIRCGEGHMTWIAQHEKLHLSRF